MRFFTVILMAAIAVISVSGQYNDTSVTITIVGGPSPTNAAQSEESACLAACAADASACLQSCIVAVATSVAGTASVNKVALCQGNCTQGNGSAADNLGYQECLTGCEQVYLTSSTSTIAILTTSITRVVSGTGAASTTSSLNASITHGNATPSSTFGLDTSGTSKITRAGGSLVAAAVLLAFTIAL